MLARRLLLVCAALLLVSALAVALAPTPERLAPTPSPPGAREAGVVTGALSTDVATPEPVTVKRGTLLRLSVTAQDAESVEIPGLDMVEAADVGSPALFEILADAPGTYPVMVSDTGRTIGRIRVEA